MDQLDAMRAFAAVAGRGSFVDAARLLRLSPAAVTRAVAQIEEHLGVQLLLRTTRSVRLTERGALYLEQCQHILDSVTDAERLVRGEDARPRGLLTVAAPLMFGRLHVLPVVQDLLRAHPDLSVRLSLSDRVVHLIEDGIDVAVRIGDPPDSSLIAIKVGAVRRVLVASPAYLAARGEPQVPADLPAHDLIAFESIDAVNEWQFGGAPPVSVRVRPRLTVNSADAAIGAAEAGLGITRPLSYQVHDAMQRGSLRPILERHAPPALPVNLMYPARRLAAPNVAAFVRAARAYFAALTVIAGPA